MSLLNRNEEYIEHRRRSWKGPITMVVLGAVGLSMAAYWQFIAERPQREVVASSRPISLGSQKPFTMPEEPPTPPPPVAEPPKAQPRRQGPPRKAEKSEAQKMQEKMRLAAHWAMPSMLRQQSGDGNERMNSNGNGHAEIQAQQVKEIPAAYRNGGGGQVNRYGDVWRTDFDRRGTGQVGIYQRASSPYVVRRGSVIPVRLRNAINTDTPGQVTAIVTQDVCDSATGRFVLIPAGAELVGGYSQQAFAGQDRVPTAWDQLNFPNGDYMMLSAFPGADRAGTAGIPADVNNHLWSNAGRSLLLTITGAAADYARRSGSGSGYGMDDAFAHEGGQNLDYQSRRMWGHRGLRPPTLTTESGQIFFVSVTQDLVFPHEYRDEVSYADTALDD